MQAETGFFSSAGAAVGQGIKWVSDALHWLFGGFFGALGDFFSGMAASLGMSPNVMNFALLLIGLMMLWAGIKAFARRSILSGIFWLVLTALLLGALIG
ncbi:hypothetical protein [Bordetella pseudohinzii]|uniref:Uncharacterized protein n=1 Tax=Bordetella pseudohinzii TaxID=1331258 RepID=A0ABM6DEZ4_9BORD|nr:hypothetical protein [Bordetella pseudohinzii]ANY16427.1 hypothetical protein BBN53_11295 [Bordetella pseudohinzii]KMM27569.1 MFS transporter [Bordetella pseudohinzii]KXA78187.1 hypothetical protein AW877_12345 [Bordetella pseudohinzii]KXA82033.1 hypothetical protein AW878_01910 [Bordetella pseudohinzii]